MVVRTRLRSIVLPIVFYLVLGVASGYLVWGASNGEHGLKAKLQYDAEAETLKVELAALKEERARWERRVAALGPQSVDRDLLDEEAHAKLDRVGEGRGGHFHRARPNPLTLYRINPPLISEPVASGRLVLGAQDALRRRLLPQRRGEFRAWRRNQRSPGTG